MKRNYFNGFTNMLSRFWNYATDLFKTEKLGSSSPFSNEQFQGSPRFRGTKKARNTKTYQHKANIEKKRKRKQRQKSQRINRKRKLGVCSWK